MLPTTSDNSPAGRTDRDVRAIPRLATEPVHRHQLCASFDRAWNLAGGVVLVCGMAGTGKTVAVTEWLRCSHLSPRSPRVAWVTLSEDHNNPRAFWDELHRSLGDWPPSRAELAPRVYADVFAQLLRVSDGRAVLVLDNAQVIHDPMTLSGLMYFLEIVPNHVTVVLTSRFAPPVAWHRLDLAGVLVRLDDADLAFNRDETHRALTASDVEVTGDELDAVVALTGGWAAMVRFVALLLSTRSDSREILAPESETVSEYPAISDFLVGELLECISAEQRAFLIRTAVAESFDVELATEIAGPDAARILAAIVAAHFPVSQTGSAGSEIYSYNPLMRSHLKAELKRTLGRAEVRRLQLRVGSWYCRVGEPIKAIRYLTAAQDRYALAKCILDLGPKAVFGLYGAAFLKVLDSAPADIADDPFVHLLRSVQALALGVPVEADAFLRAASAHSSSMCPAEVFERFRGAVEIDIRSALGDDGVHRSLPTVLGDQRDIESYIAVQQAKCAMTTGDQGAGDDLRAAIRMAEHTGSVRPHLEALMLLALDEGAHGRVAAMGARARIGLEYAQNVGLSGSGDAGRCAVMFRYHHFLRGTPLPEGNDQQLTMAVGSDGLSTPLAGWGSLVMAKLIAFEQVTNTADAARDVVAMVSAMLADARMDARSTPTITFATHVLVAAHELEKAQRIIEEATRVLGRNPHVDLAAAIVEHARGRSARARELLDSVLSHQLDQAISTIEAYLLRAAVRAASDREYGVYDDLEAALALAEPEHLVRPFLIVSGAVPLLDSHSGRFGRLDPFVECIRTHPEAAHTSTTVVLTPAEIRVLKQLPSPQTAQEIAQALALSVNTIKTHLRGLYAKLGVSSRGDAITAARLTGLL